MKKILNFFKNIFSKEKEKEEDDHYRSPYCPECSACGEEGCCSPTMCKQSENGHYCDRYLKDLKYSYDIQEEFLKHLYEDAETNKDLISLYNKICDETYDKYYGQKK